MPIELLNLTNLRDLQGQGLVYGLDLCNNHLRTDNLELSCFLKSKHRKGDWEWCQSEVEWILVKASNECEIDAPCFRTVSQALEHASGGEKIKVCQGTYQENVEINKDVIVLDSRKF